jgi:hypothetical protein
LFSFSLEKLGSVLTLYLDIAGRRVAYIQPSIAKVQPTRAKTGLRSACTAAIFRVLYKIAELSFFKLMGLIEKLYV